jgi:hypothetical protein
MLTLTQAGVLTVAPCAVTAVGETPVLAARADAMMSSLALWSCYSANNQKWTHD